MLTRFAYTCTSGEGFSTSRAMPTRIAIALVIALVATVAAFLVSLIPAAESASLRGLDLLHAVAADPDDADPRIVMVEVDQASLNHFADDDIPFPWPRSLYNPVVAYAAAGGAKGVLFDILFTGETPFGPAVDASFADAIEDAGNVTLAAAFFRGESGRVVDLPPRFGRPYTGAPPDRIATATVEAPLPILVDAAAALGSVTNDPDVDGVYRRVRPVRTYQGRAVPSLTTAPLMGEGPVRFVDGGLYLGDRFVPTDDDGSYLLRYHGGRDTYRSYPIAAVISSYMQAQAGETPAIPPDAFKDAYVIVGYTATGLYDLKPTPLSPVSPGPMVHAVLLDNLLNGDGIRIAPVAVAVALGFAGASLIAAGTLAWGPIAVGATMVATATALFGATLALMGAGWWVDLLGVEFPPTLALMGAALYRYRTEGVRRRQLSHAFGHYLSPAMVAKVAADPDSLKLGGERRELTVFFCDLAGFTSLSERLSPEELVGVLNDYTSAVTDVILEREGTVDKFIGDAVMAFWNAPADQPDHAVRGVDAALAAVAGLARLNVKLAQRNLPQVAMRVGVNSGPCVVGNMGSARRFNYTAIGDPVNEASRFEGLNKAYATGILAAEPTVAACDGRFFVRQVDYLTVKGKERPVMAYEVMARTGEETPEQRWIKDAYESALALYRDRKWDEAAAALAPIGGIDPTARLLADRIGRYRLSPPPADWNGAYAHTAK
jgi:adenylate cyclase